MSKYKFVVEGCGSFKNSRYVEIEADSLDAATDILRENKIDLLEEDLSRLDLEYSDSNFYALEGDAQ